MKILLLLLIALLQVAAPAWAETVHLKNGKTVKGRILEKGSYYIKIESGGVPHQYFNGEIDSIESDNPEADKKKEVQRQSLNKIPASKLNLINQLIEANGTRRNIAKNFDDILKNTPPERQENLRKLLQADEITQRLIPIYDKYFSEQELVDLIKFYQSPIGQKAIDSSPKIMSEALQVTIKYFEEKLDSIKH